MSSAEQSEAYNRLTASATGKDSTRKEVKICYVTVCFPPLYLFTSVDVVWQPERIGKSSRFKSVLATMVAAKKLGEELLSLA
jgi:hypothetical protein